MSFLEKALEMAKARGSSASQRNRRPASTQQGVTGVPFNEHFISQFPVLETSETSIFSQMISGDIAGMAPLVNAVKVLRTKVLRSVDANRLHRIGITSCMQGEGKSFIALSLAIAIAQTQGRQVILVDLDLRRPSIARQLFAKMQVDECLTRNFIETATSIPFESSFQRIDKLPLLVALTANPQPNASDILASPLGKNFFINLRRMAPDALVIFDLPPALVVDDAMVVSDELDGFLFVAGKGIADKRGISHLTGQFDQRKIIGIVLNKSTDGGSVYGYDYSGTGYY